MGNVGDGIDLTLLRGLNETPRDLCEARAVAQVQRERKLRKRIKRLDRELDRLCARVAALERRNAAAYDDEYRQILAQSPQ